MNIFHGWPNLAFISVLFSVLAVYAWADGTYIAWLWIFDAVIFAFSAFFDWATERNLRAARSAGHDAWADSIR